MNGRATYGITIVDLGGAVTGLLANERAGGRLTGAPVLFSSSQLQLLETIHGMSGETHLGSTWKPIQGRSRSRSWRLQ